MTGPEWPNILFEDYEPNRYIIKAQGQLKYHSGIITAHLHINYSESIGYFGNIEFRFA